MPKNDKLTGSGHQSRNHVEDLQNFTQRLRQHGHDNYLRLPVSIEDKTIVEINLLCHEIDIYIKEHKPVIGLKNLKAFNNLYYTSSALVSKMGTKHRKSRSFFRDLSILLTSLTRISLV